MQDTGDAADDAKKKVDKFIASFDEVFQVPEKDAAGINAIKDFNLPKLDNTNDKNGDKNKDDGLGGFKLPDFPKNIFLPALTWPFKWSDITQPVQEFVTNLEQWLADASAAVGSWVGQVLGELGKVPAWVRGWINELGGEFGSLPGLVWNPALAGVLAFVAGVIAAFNPIGGVIALAVAAFSLFNNVPAGLQTVLDAITNWVTNLTTQLGLINTLISVWAAGLLPLIQPGLAALVLGWTGAWQNIYNSLVPVLQQIQLDWTTFWTNLQTNMNTAIPIIQAAVTVWLTNWITEWQTDLANLQTQWTTFWTNLETATNIAIPIIQAAVSGWMANWMAEWGIDLAALKANWDGFSR
jgi:hypothetical protein